MTGMGDPRVAYCTVEDIRDAVDVAPGTAALRRIPRAIYAASTGIEGLLNRRFYPLTDTRSFDWPLNYQYAVPWRLWLDADEALSVDSIVTGGRTLAPGTDFILKPENAGPPYSNVEIRLSSGAMWGTDGSSFQQAIQLNGVFGGCDDTETTGALATGIDATTTTVTVSGSGIAPVGTLDTIRIGTEWMTVHARAMTSTGQRIQAPLNAAKNDTMVDCQDGSMFTAGETLLIGPERVLITDIADNTLIVQRATDGTVLAEHTNSLIYAARKLTVSRGLLGSAPATHPAGGSVERLAVPELVRQVAIAETLADTELQSMGYTSQRGDDGRETSIRELNDLRNRAYTRWARQSRSRAV